MIPSVRISTQEGVPIQLDGGIWFESWFTREDDVLVRTEIYKAEDDSVVAFQDCVLGDWKPLYVEKQFFELFQGEDSLQAIMNQSGVQDVTKFRLFDMGR